MKTVIDCKDVSILSLQDEQLRQTGLPCLCTVFFFCFIKYNTMQSKLKQTKIVNKADRNLTNYKIGCQVQ